MTADAGDALSDEYIVVESTEGQEQESQTLAAVEEDQPSTRVTIGNCTTDDSHTDEPDKDRTLELTEGNGSRVAYGDEDKNLASLPEEENGDELLTMSEEEEVVTVAVSVSTELECQPQSDIVGVEAETKSEEAGRGETEKRDNSSEEDEKFENAIDDPERQLWESLVTEPSAETDEVEQASWSQLETGTLATGNSAATDSSVAESNVDAVVTKDVKEHDGSDSVVTDSQLQVEPNAAAPTKQSVDNKENGDVSVASEITEYASTGNDTNAVENADAQLNDDGTVTSEAADDVTSLTEQRQQTSDSGTLALMESMEMGDDHQADTVATEIADDEDGVHSDFTATEEDLENSVEPQDSDVTLAAVDSKHDADKSEELADSGDTSERGDKIVEDSKTAEELSAVSLQF